MKLPLVLLFAFCLFHENVFGISITYSGSKCLNATNSNDATPSGIPVQSRFEVIEDVGSGMYRLNLTGGIPRIINNNPVICIDSDTAIGFAGIPEVDGIPRPLDSINATAFFNGKELFIVVSSIATDLSARRNPLSSFSTSLIFTFTNTLILEYSPTGSIFRLKKIIYNRGFTHTSGSTNSVIPFFETILPSFNEIARDLPKILTPIVDIDYSLEK